MDSGTYSVDLLATVSVPLDFTRTEFEAVQAETSFTVTLQDRCTETELDPIVFEDVSIYVLGP